MISLSKIGNVEADLDVINNGPLIKLLDAI